MELDFGKKEGIDGVDITIKTCKSALSKSGLESDYALNPYTGCTHGCKYCYAPFVLNEDREWGTFVDVKRNFPKVLADELNKIKDNTVRMGSVTDPYQEIEGQYRITRMCLEQLKRKDIPTIIQTKSDLVTRDIDILKNMDIDVGFTITSLDDEFRKKFEPNSPSFSKRLSAVKKLMENDIDVWVFIGPLLPYFNDKDEELIRLSETLDSLGVDEIYLDKLNMRKGIWDKLKNILSDKVYSKYKKIYSGDKKYFEDRKKFYKKIGKIVF
ncbi:MAG: radical SAM protein [Thermoplasmatota archaeon]